MLILCITEPDEEKNGMTAKFKNGSIIAFLLMAVSVLDFNQVEARRFLPTEESSQNQTAPVPKPTAIETKTGLTINETLLVNGMVRKALVHLPPYYTVEDKRPLVVVLHGARLSGWIAEAATGFDKIANQENFIVTYPDALHQQWDDGRSPTDTPSYGVDDVGFISQLIDYIDWKYHIKKDEVYVVGFSSGGMLTQKFGLEQTEKVTAIAEVAASLPIPQMELQKKPSRPLSVLMINGTNDPAFPWAGGMTRIVRVRVGAVAPIMATYQYWINANGGPGSSPPRQEVMQKNKIGTSVNLLNTRTANGSCIMLYRINGGGHTWPGSEVPLYYIPFLGRQSRALNASELIWEFFKREHSDC
jgi:polyhydroxybutyrate depolymerase